MSSQSALILEENRRLSESIVWQLQRNFYNRHGIKAWSQGTVPHYVTSNPFIAKAYAEIVFGYLRDCVAITDHAPDAAFPQLDPHQPVYIIELGAGSGRFSYHFLQSFLQIWQGSSLASLPIKYIMTDFSEPLIEYWQSHAHLAPLVKQGLLDFAHFDVSQDQALTLLQSGQELAPGTVSNPLIAIANYIFDTIPQDCFFIKDHRLFESLVTVAVTSGDADTSDPELIERISVQYDHHPTNASYYDDRDFNHLLRTYSHQLNHTSLLFPQASLRGIRSLRNISADRLLLVSGDKGYIQEEGLEGWGDQELTTHGSFSMMVNYHAIAEYVRHVGGRVFTINHPHEHLNISAFLMGQHPTGFAETRHAYQKSITQFGPDEFYTLKEAAEDTYDKQSPQQILAFLRLGNWDSAIFSEAYSSLQNQLGEADYTTKKLVKDAIDAVWKMYYPIGETLDIAFQLGMLLYALDDYEEAMVYFQYSLELHGLDPSTTYNLALCCFALQRHKEALEWVEETLETDPAFEGAQSLWQEISAELEDAEAS